MRIDTILLQIPLNELYFFEKAITELLAATDWWNYSATLIRQTLRGFGD